MNITQFIVENTESKIPIGKHNHIPDDFFDSNELKLGIETEYEHTDITEYAKAIAKDHLMECEDYYSRLIQMEVQCLKQK